MKYLPATVAAMMLGLCLLLPAGRVHAEPDLSKLDLGSHAAGPEITLGDLRGRVVVIEYWGITCGPCIKSIPHTTELAEKYGHDKLVIVANQVWSASDKQCQEVWEKHAKSNFVAVVNGGKLPGFSPRGVPSAVMFDHTGKKIWEGHPSGMDQALANAVKNVPDKPATADRGGLTAKPIIEGLEAKYFERDIEMINEQKRAISGVLAKLRKIVEKASKQEQVDEASAILAAVTTWAQARQSEAEAALKDDPATAYALSEKTLEVLGRDELGNRFSEIKTQIESDAALMDEVRATNMLREVQALAQSIGLTDDPAAAERSPKEMREIARDLRRIIKAWPETEAGKEAAALSTQWGLDD